MQYNVGATQRFSDGLAVSGWASQIFAQRIDYRSIQKKTHFCYELKAVATLVLRADTVHYHDSEESR
jgi:hypothetical protein